MVRARTRTVERVRTRDRARRSIVSGLDWCERVTFAGSRGAVSRFSSAELGTVAATLLRVTGQRVRECMCLTTLARPRVVD